MKFRINENISISGYVYKMGKRGGFPGGMGGFGGMNINQLMKEAKKMQADMEKSQEELGSREFDSTAGGGAVYVKVNGM